MSSYIFQPDRYLLAKNIEQLGGKISGRVLDVGAGRASRYEKYFKAGEYVKLDNNPDFGPDVVGSAEDIPLSASSFDAVVCTQVLGDLKNPRQAMKEFARVLKSGGHLLFSDAFINPLHDEPDDFWRYTNYGFKVLLAEAGFEVMQELKRGGFHITKAQLNIRYLIEKYKLYQKFWGSLASKVFKIYFLVASFRDRIDKSEAGQKYTIGWDVLARKK